ncbi:PAS domain S-box protein [Mucilaginibacter sp. CSA2-8R]|uniref:PAS domain S-box protein n=1 Tax=Mucilaginibacter sp. CSA2-8R TaxID=3141542 RepID=UPI00315DDA36
MNLPAETCFSAFQKSSTGIIVKHQLSVGFTVVTVTDLFEELTGLKRSELINQSIFTCFKHHNTLYKLLGLHSDVLQNAVNTEADIVIPAAPYGFVEKSTGKLNFFWWQTTYQKLSSPNASEQYILISLKKASAPDEATGANDTYEHFKGLFELAPTLACVLHGSELRIQRMNQRLSDLIGETLLNVQNEPISKFVKDKAFGSLINNAKKTYQSGKTFQSSGERFLVNRGGNRQELFFDCIFEPVRNQNGNVTAVIFIGHEVSHYVAALDQVQAHEKQLELIFDNVKDVLYMIEVEPGFNFKFIAVNNSFTEVTGLPQELIVGKYLHEVIPPESIDLVRGNYITAIREHKTMHWKEVSQYPTGQKTGLVTITPVFDKNGECTKMIGSVHDITDQTRHETDMQHSQQELQRVINDLMARNRALEHFTYVISHHLRAPAANIIGLVNLFKLGDLNDDGLTEIINGLLISSEALDTVIHDLNDILNLRERNMEQQTVVRLNDIINNLKVSLHDTLIKEKATINLDCERLDHIYTVESYLYSIFYNLISNSIKFRKRHEPPQINIRCYDDGENHILIFKDNGKGLDLEKFGRDLFGLYNKFDNSVSGKGIGLYLVKTQVEGMGGTVTASSQPLEGMEIIVTLPHSYQT